MKAIPIPVVLVFLLPFLVSFTPSNPRLVLIERGAAESFEILEEYLAKPHNRGDGWVLATVSDGDIDPIARAGFQVRIIDIDPWSEPYYLVHRSHDGREPNLPTSFREIARVPEGRIVKGPQVGITELIALELRVSRIHDATIPLAGKESFQFSGLSPAWQVTGQSIADQVSDSALTKYVTRLTDFQTRLFCGDSVEAAAEWIHDQFVDFGFTEVYYDSFPLTGYPCEIQRNVVAVKRGTVHPDRYIVVGGHYDSFVLPTEPCNADSFAPGADDNATGTAGVLEAARILVNEEIDISVIFVAFAFEELGLWGSTHFAQEALETGMEIYLMANMDMIGFLRDNIWDVYLFSPSVPDPFYHIFADIAYSYTDLITVHIPSPQSDDYPFAQRGFNTIGVEEGDWPSPHWHRCTDTIENLTLPYFTDVVEMVTLSTLYIGTTPMPPDGFRMANVGDGTSLCMSWDPSPEPDLAGYRIYWGTEPENYDSLRTVTSVGDTLRNLPEGTTVYMAISAFDTEEQESFLTPEESITTSSVPDVPTGITSTSLETGIVLDWEPNLHDLDLAGYNLYRWEIGFMDTVLYDFIPAPSSYHTDLGVEEHVLYGYHVTAVDTEDPANESVPSEDVLGRLATHDLGILVVDQTQNGAGGPFLPTDEEVDTFYADLLRDYNHQATWDHGDSAAAERNLMDYDTGIYSTILWHTDVRNAQNFGSDTTTIRKFLGTGGNLWMTGWQVLAQLTGESDSYFRFEDASFFSDFMGVDSARTTSSADQDFIGAESVAGGFPSVDFDSAMVHPIGGLYNTEVLLPPFDGSYAIYTYISSNGPGSAHHGQPVGIASSSSEYGLVFTDFPLYFLEWDDARSLAAAVMDLFEEPVGIGDEKIVGLPRSFALSQNYPNPFNPSTTIAVDIPVTGGDPEAAKFVTLAIYDLRGRMVRILIEGERSPGRYQVHWDGRNDRGRSVGSGVYLYRIVAGDFKSTKKMVLVR